MKSLAFVLCLSVPLSQDLEFCLRILDCPLLVHQLDLQLLQFDLFLPKDNGWLFYGSSQGLEFVGTLNGSKLSPFS